MELVTKEEGNGADVVVIRRGWVTCQRAPLPTRLSTRPTRRRVLMSTNSDLTSVLAWLFWIYYHDRSTRQIEYSNMPSAPLAESSQPRGILKTSRYDSKHTAIEDKENHIGHNDDGDVADEDVDEYESEDEEIVEPPFPHTPAVRIPLEDLIGNTEDAFNCEPPLATPRDHVTWQHGPASSDPSVSVRGTGTQMSRKRARSSSPSSSQVDRSAHFEGQRDALDMNSVHKTLRTPNNDPTQELWNRYMSANISRNQNGEFVLPSFANLPPSSPQTPSTGSKDSALRRTASCGVEWPTSKPKRRKIDTVDSHSRTKNIFAASRKEILAQNMPKTSRVGLLIEKIQESLNKHPRVDDEPSSSSPLPGRHSQMPPTQASPTRSPSKLSKPVPVPNGPARNETSASPSRPGRGSSSEFGDDDVDLDLFESVEKQFSQLPISQEPPNSKPLPKTGPATRTENLNVTSKANSLVRSPVKPTSAPRKSIDGSFDTNFDDEFDDEDETFAEELQVLADKVDSQNQINKISAVDGACPAIANVENKGGGDEFDDDDDDVWAQLADDTIQGRPVVGSTSQVRPR
jgi:DNA replication ATP-dependent helicase Dna2